MTKVAQIGYQPIEILWLYQHNGEAEEDQRKKENMGQVCWALLASAGF